MKASRCEGSRAWALLVVCLIVSASSAACGGKDAPVDDALPECTDYQRASQACMRAMTGRDDPAASARVEAFKARTGSGATAKDDLRRGVVRVSRQ